MGERWFRHYSGMMRDEKLVRVALDSKQPIERVLWIWGAILESAAGINDGGRYDVHTGEIARFLSVDEADIRAIVGGLETAGRVNSGVVTNWGHRQFQSDKSAARQRKYRDKTSRDGLVTAALRHSDAPETETETETETDKKKDRGTPSASAPAGFEKFKEAYPKRGASNPWKPARELFERAIKSGHDPGMIILAAKAYSAECDRNKITATDKVAQAQTWLRQERFLDYAQAAGTAVAGYSLAAESHSRQWDAWRAHKIANGESVGFMDAQRERGGHWTVPSEWPPGHKPQEAA